jgi:hypothetical protein
VELISLFYLSLLVPGLMTKVIIWGKSGQLLECYFTQPLACSLRDFLFCHPFLTVPETPVTAGMGFTISTKSSNSPPPRHLFLLPPPSGTNRSHSVYWWDDCRVNLDGPPYSNKTQRSLTVSTPKNNIPSSLRDDEDLCLSFINSLKQQGLLISCFTLYNKSKTLIKVNFKIQVTK